MKMSKLKNNKGFVLVETLVAAVFVMAVFSVIYVNFYPIMAEYERREAYDDVDSKYSTYWIKKIIQSGSVSFDGTIASDIANNKYHRFQCDDIAADDATARKYCTDLFGAFEVSKDNAGKLNVYITSYKLGNRADMTDKNNFKGVVEENAAGEFTSGFQDYVSFLPTYSKVSSLNGACYRVLVEFHHTRNDNDYWTYSNLEVIKGNERCW